MRAVYGHVNVAAQFPQHRLLLVCKDGLRLLRRYSRDAVRATLSVQRHPRKIYCMVRKRL
jgi:hypothetical protein